MTLTIKTQGPERKKQFCFLIYDTKIKEYGQCIYTIWATLWKLQLTILEKLMVKAKIMESFCGVNMILQNAATTVCKVSGGKKRNN